MLPLELLFKLVNYDSPSIVLSPLIDSLIRTSFKRWLQSPMIADYLLDISIKGLSIDEYLFLCSYSVAEFKALIPVWLIYFIFAWFNLKSFCVFESFLFKLFSYWFLLSKNCGNSLFFSIVYSFDLLLICLLTIKFRFVFGLTDIRILGKPPGFYLTFWFHIFYL